MHGTNKIVKQYAYTFSLVVERYMAHVFVHITTQLSGVRALVKVRTRKWLGVAKAGFSFLVFREQVTVDM